MPDTPAERRDSDWQADQPADQQTDRWAERTGGWAGDWPDLRAEARAVGDAVVAVITLNLPDKRNAMSDPMTASWRQVMTELARDRRVAAVVVTGAGPAFCAGGDLSWLAGDPDATVDTLRTKMLAFYRSWLTIKSLEVPTIAAINGAAIGAGLAVALACDIRYAAQDARLAVPFTSLGLHPGMATTWSLPDVVGPAIARDMLLTGRAVTGAEAVGLGLASAAYPAPDLLPAALAAADRVASAAPIATRLTTLALRDGGHATFEAALAWEALAQPITMATADLHEGLAAVAARRPARFTGR